MSIVLDGANGITYPNNSTQNIAYPVAATFGFKNRIINGAMMIDQRNAGGSVTPSGGGGVYTVDRWVGYGSQNSKFTVQQNAGSVTPPAGFVNYLGSTSSSAYTVGSSETFVVQQFIEGYNIADLGWGTADAKTVTLSFWARSSLTGTFGGALLNNAQNRSYTFSYTISSANTWTFFTITIPGDTSGTWLTTNGIGIRVTFSLGSGSTVSGTAGSWSGNQYFSSTGAVSVVGTNGATFYLTGVQLEVGSSATSFDYREYGRELILCQRYCQVIGNGSMGRWNSTSGFENGVLFKTTMRTSPAVAAYSTTPNLYNIGVASTTASGYSVTINGASPTGAMLVGSINAWGSASAGAFFAMASDSMLFTAEL